MQMSSQAGNLVVTGEILDELYVAGDAEKCGLGREDFAAALGEVGTRLNFGASGKVVEAQRVAFFGGLQLKDLALAQGCARGLDLAWERFVDKYREPLTRAAVAIAGSATDGHELAGSLYGDLFGLKERDGVRKSPLESYSGRGSLMGWLRTTLAQRHVDRHRKTKRETPLESDDGPREIAAKPETEATPYAGRMAEAVSRTLGGIGAENRFLLASYFLDRRTLKEIARMLRVHEATISRRIGRLTEELRKQLLRNLQAGGLSRRAAEEAMGTDPRDVEVNVRAILQGLQAEAFQEQQGSE